MTKRSLGALLASFLVIGLSAANVAAQTCPVAAEDAAAEDCPSFTRQLGIGGMVTGSFAEATAAAGAPETAIRQATNAFGTTIDLDRDLHDGDHFYLRWEQPFTLDGQPTGDSRLVWAELRTKTRGTIVLQRLRPRDGEEQLFLTSGQAAAPPKIRMPLEVMQVTSGYGLRRDPLDQPVILVPPPPQAVHAPEAAVDDQPPPLLPQDAKEVKRAFAGVHLGGEPPAAPATFDEARNAQIDGVMARRRARAHAESARKAEQEAEAAQESARQAATPPVVQAAPAPPPPPPQLFMHTGLDLLANSGTPIYAAADGLVMGARPNGLYGNWIRIDHPGKLATVYGHLLRFAPGIEPGVVVGRGELIGFVGNTGRSTGSHLHFELLLDGHPVNPANHPATKPRQLAGPDLDRLRKEIAASHRELELEQQADETVALAAGVPLHPI